MPAHITAYVYVMAMALTMFALLKRPLTASLMTPEDFDRRRLAWIGVTSAAFLAHNFWVFVFAAGVIVVLTAQRDRNPPALYLLLLLAVPNFEADVPGFGVVNFLMRMSPARLLALLILAPIAFRLIQTYRRTETTLKVNQIFVLVFCAMVVVVMMLSDSPINTLANNLRNVIDVLLLIVIPFYVMAHALRDLRQLREALACLLIGFALLGVFALFETLRYWLVFETMRGPLGLPPPRLTLYVMRETEGGGALRAMATAGHPIVLGYFMAVGVCLWVAMRRSMKPPVLGLVVLGAVAIGLLVALSRGPWVAAAAGMLALILAGPNAGKRIVVTSAVLAAVALGLMVTPYGEKIIGYIPFVGSVERGTVDYRVKLIEVSMMIFWDNPIFGSYNSLIDPRLEEMRQGQGIIDMVNTYLGVALQYGIVGVFLFVTPFVLAGIATIRRAREVELDHEMMGITGRALAGAIVTTLVVIATTSSVEYMPMVYWPLLGCATAYLGVAARWREARRSTSVRPYARAGARVVAAPVAAAVAAPAAASPAVLPVRRQGRGASASTALRTGPSTPVRTGRGVDGGAERADSPDRPDRPVTRPAHRTYPDRT
jgi:O-Antigen ligase